MAAVVRIRVLRGWQWRIGLPHRGPRWKCSQAASCSSSSTAVSSGDDDGAARGHLLSGGSAQGRRVSRRPLPLRGEEERERRGGKRNMRGGEGEKERR
uniref:Uncharacterized protein n=1 Tax=Oryza meridionalis TaxID=40149 RepID=A0A0E0C3C3_9ORYZ